jgi:hypothetical protein
MSLSTGIFVFVCACCWVAVIAARAGVLRSKRRARDPQGMRVLRGALEKRGDVADVRNVRRVRDVRNVKGVNGLRGGRNRRG